MPLRVSKDARASWGIQVNFAFSTSGFSRRLNERPITKVIFDPNLTVGHDASIGGKRISLACPFTRFSRALS
jgi:hypothetical protein